MKISGFSFVRNGISLYYPIVESIKSILPIVDEFVIAVGKSSGDDNTREKIEQINNPKINIIDTDWEEKYFKRNYKFHSNRYCNEGMQRRLAFLSSGR